MVFLQASSLLTPTRADLQLVDEHQKFERQLAEYTGRPFLTVEEQFRETIIKKKKLALKDRMQMLIHRIRVQGSVN